MYKKNSGKRCGFATNVKFYKANTTEDAPSGIDRDKLDYNMVGLIHTCPPYLPKEEIKDKKSYKLYQNTQTDDLIRTYEGILYQFFKAYLLTKGEICGLYLYPLCIDTTNYGSNKYKRYWSSIGFKYKEGREYKDFVYKNIATGKITKNENKFMALLTFYCLGKAMEKMTNLFYNDLLRIDHNELNEMNKECSEEKADDNNSDSSSSSNSNDEYYKQVSSKKKNFKKIDIQLLLPNEEDRKLYQTEFNKKNYYILDKQDLKNPIIYNIVNRPPVIPIPKN